MGALRKIFLNIFTSKLFTPPCLQAGRYIVQVQARLCARRL